MTVAVIDSGVANLASVMAALSRLGVSAEVTADAQKISNASRVILPGVGAASAAMTQLNTKNLVPVLRSLTQPVLGICLGMQILFTYSEESGGCDCLDIIPGDVRQLRPVPDKPIPHMGWNSITPHKAHPLMRGLPVESFVYFVHSFAAPIADYTQASCDYTESFTAIAGHKNFFGCQFHPERSGAIGAQILKNFMSM